MADTLQELAAWIIASTGHPAGSWGRPPNTPPAGTVFAGDAPPDLDVPILLIRDAGGRPQMITEPHGDIGEYLFQVIARSDDYFAAKALAYDVHDMLHGAIGHLLGDAYLHTADAVSAPQSLGFDERRRHLFSTTYRVTLHIVPQGTTP